MFHLQTAEERDRSKKYESAQMEDGVNVLTAVSYTDEIRLKANAPASLLITLYSKNSDGSSGSCGIALNGFDLNDRTTFEDTKEKLRQFAKDIFEMAKWKEQDEQS